MTHFSIFVQLSPNQQEILTIYILIVEFQRRHFVLSPVCSVPICISVHTISFYGCMTKWRVYGGVGNVVMVTKVCPFCNLLSGTFNSLSAANTVHCGAIGHVIMGWDFFCKPPILMGIYGFLWTNRV